MLDIILPLIPIHKIYVECFSGSAIVWLNKQPATINVINDLDPNIKKGMSLIRNAPIDITKYKHLDTDEQAQVFYDKTPITPSDKLLHFRLQQMGGFNSIPIVNNKIVRKVNIYPAIIQSIIQTKKLLSKSIVLNEDYEKVIKKYDSKDTFFFLDPPYEGTSPKNWGYAQGDGEFNYDTFYNNIQTIKGKFMITINDSPRFRKMFNKYFIKKVNVPNIRDHSIRKELIIMNYRL